MDDDGKSFENPEISTVANNNLSGALPSPLYSESHQRQTDRTKKVGATSNKRLRDEDDSEEGDNSKEQNQQLSKRPRTDDETGAHHQQPFLTVYRYNGVQNDEHH
ncbi:hypothetical protein FAUST_8937 [Fusarium austroamericanum]|uniref:Uncharacterized protein n=1 Tax=Fusarium austroamericanum TaxID=282268 RepID=A0AAN5Z3P7_FUSAU|nr:hypothetical protein FAUST_8937 [Fusarium austroamericanum]